MGDRKRRSSFNEELESELEDSLLWKRFCGMSPEAEELMHILEDAEEERYFAEEEIVCGVMKSLEEEITLCCSAVENEVSAEGESRTCDVEDEMRYLLNASDDELGIPPSPSVGGSPLYNCDSYLSFAEIVEGLFWRFEDGDCNLGAAPVGGEVEERGFGEGKV